MEDDDEEVVPRGFRFYPTEEELVSFFLQNKLDGSTTHTPQIDRVIPLLDIYDHNPSDLPQLGGEYSPAEGEQWFFFIPRKEREARGGRPNRLTNWGYWKATGSPANVYSSDNRVIGRKRTMVFYVGRAPAGRKTEWKMNEYKAVHMTNPDHAAPSSSSSSSSTPQLREELSLCRIYKRSKCLRAFDRRPPPVVASGNPAAVVLHRHDAAPSAAVPETTDCSSCSGDQTANINYQDNNISDSEPSWDLEDLNLFDLLDNNSN